MLLEPGVSREEGLVDDHALLRAMLDVEAAWVRVLRDLGATTDDVVRAVAAATRAEHHDLAHIAAGTEAGGNPVIPMLASLRSALIEDARSGPESALSIEGEGPIEGTVAREAAAVVHRGLTSQDVLDTALMLLAHRALGRLEEHVGRTADAAATLADRHRATIQTARTLGQPALPMTFGLKAAGWLGALDDVATELAATRAGLPVQCGAAAGTLAAIDVAVPGRALEAVDLLARELGLASLGRPWHTDRGPITRLGDALVRAADAFGKIAGDIVLLSRPEIGELREPAGEGRGVSSTLPQKRNPVLSVLVRSVAIEAPHLGAVLHTAAALAVDERPDGAWHAEWPALVALLRRVTVAAGQLADVLGGVDVDAAAMRRNVEAAGPALVAERLLAAVRGLVPRSDVLIANLREALRTGSTTGEVRALLRAGLLPGGADEATIEDLLSPAAYLGVADRLVDRALSRHRAPHQGGSP